MNHFPTRPLAFLLTALCLALLSGNALPTRRLASAVAASAGSCTWHRVISPSLEGGLRGVAASSQTDGWVVGSNGGAGIIGHWDGTHWSAVPSPQPGTYTNSLYGVAALSSRDAWAVGADEDLDGSHLGKQKTLIEHWDGTQWKHVSSPNTTAYFNLLQGVAALSPDDVWAVGAATSRFDGSSKVLIEHWDGTRWSMIASPDPGAYTNDLQGVAAFSPGDVWAVGKDANGNAGARTLTEHWNGQHWSVVKSPSIGGYDNELRAVGGVSPHDLWAVGLHWEAPGDIVVTLTEHWNGSTWSTVASPNMPGNLNGLSGVAAPATTDVWAVGFDGSANGALLEHWVGTHWSIVANPGSSTWGLASVTALSPHDIWAVGYRYATSLILHRC